MAVPELLRLALGEQAVLGILANRLEQAIARPPASRFDDDKRLVDEGRNEIEHLTGIHRPVGAYRLGGIERPTAAEHRQPPQHRLLAPRKQPVAPVDQRFQCLLARKGRATPSGEETKAIVETAGDLLDGEEPGSRGRKLHCEWDPVEAPAYLRKRRSIPFAEIERLIEGASPLDKEPHRLAAADRFKVGLLGGRDSERRHSLDLFSRYSERLEARREDANSRTVPEEVLGEGSAGLDEMFTVVEEHQQLPGPQVLDEEIFDP